MQISLNLRARSLLHPHCARGVRACSPIAEARTATLGRDAGRPWCRTIMADNRPFGGREALFDIISRYGIMATSAHVAIIQTITKIMTPIGKIGTPTRPPKASRHDSPVPCRHCGRTCDPTDCILSAAWSLSGTGTNRRREPRPQGKAGKGLERVGVSLGARTQGSAISADCRACAIPLRHSCGDCRPSVVRAPRPTQPACVVFGGLSLGVSALCSGCRMSRGTQQLHPRYPTDCICSCTPHGCPVEGHAFCEGPPPWRGPRAPPTKAGAAMWRASEQRQSLGRAIVRRRQWVGKSKATHAPEGAREMIKARASRRKAGEESRHTIERPQRAGRGWLLRGKAIGLDVGWLRAGIGLEERESADYCG